MRTLVQLWAWLGQVKIIIRWPVLAERDWCDEGRGPLR